MSGRSRARSGDDRGATIVEFAIVGVILFSLMLGLLSYAIIEFGNAAGSNAAREGARVGIIDFENAHQAGSPSNTKIVSAVRSKLVGLDTGTTTITIRCVNASGNPLAGPPVGSCAKNAVTIGTDSIEVRVTWQHVLPLPGLSSSKTDTARMVIVGKPDLGTGGTPGVCTLSNPRATPSTATLTTSNMLNSDVVIRVDVSSLTDCGAPQLTPPAESGVTSVQTMVLETGTTFAYTIEGTDSTQSGPWSAGTKSVPITAVGGTVTTSTTFEVQSAAIPCTIGPITFTTGSAPNDRIKAKSTGQKEIQNGPITFSVTVNDATACGALTIAASPSSSGILNTAQAMTASGLTHTFVVANGNRDWDAGTKTITVSSTIVAVTSTLSVLVASS